MNVSATPLDGLLVLEPKVFGDDRGFFFERYSRSVKGVLHGLHYQIQQTQRKLVRADYWAPEHERAILWNDPAIGIGWPALDAAAALLANAEVFA